MDKRWRYFMAGAVAYGCLKSLGQDAIGQEACLKVVEHAWVSPWISVPVAAIVLFGAIVMMAPDPPKGEEKT